MKTAPIFFIFICCLSLTLAAKKPAANYLDSKTAAAEDPDFLFQGEYTGDGVGVQVVALVPVAGPVPPPISVVMPE